MKKLLTMMFLTLLALCCAAVCLAESHTCSGGTATCESLAVCATCGKTYGHLADHSWGSWVSDGASTHTRTCQTNAAHQETRYHMGGASTCTEGAKCVTCGAVHEEPLGHVPTLYAGYPATCESTGTTDGETCSRCGSLLTARRIIPASGHSYNAWTPSGDGTHTAVCTTAGCASATAVLCTPFEVTVEDSIVTVCPICGGVGSEIMPVLLAQQVEALPIGQLLVRGMAEPFDGALYAFTVAGSYAGACKEPDSMVTVTLADDFAALPAFRVVRVDVTPATETAERTESWTEVEFRFADGQLTLSTDVIGLFLLVAAE